MTDADDALPRLAEALRSEGSVISPHAVSSPADAPVLGALVAAGPRAAGHEADYAFVIEALREGYLLHYGEPRIVRGADRDLSLLAGDYLYALGLERLAALGDPAAVGELSDLLSLSAQVHAEGRAEHAGALWLASVVAVACGPSAALTNAKAALRGGDGDAGRLLADAARDAASTAGIATALEGAADAIDFPSLTRG